MRQKPDPWWLIGVLIVICAAGLIVSILSACSPTQITVAAPGCEVHREAIGLAAFGGHVTYIVKCKESDNAEVQQ